MTIDGDLQMTTSKAHNRDRTKPKVMKNFIHKNPRSKFCGMLENNMF